MRHRPAGWMLAGCLALAGCTPGSPGRPATAPATPVPRATTTATTTATAGPSGSAAGTPSTSPTPAPEPTTTNTLPPPPAPSRPAPSTAGRLSAASLPLPKGWRTVALPGGGEEGYRGNGTWVHAKDPRYAANDAITIGCAQITRDDYPDPVAALEGNYENRHGEPGVGLVLQFVTDDDAQVYYRRYVEQVEACTDRTDPVHTSLVSSDGRLIDRRSYPDGQWTEMGRVVGPRLTLIILGDPGHKISAPAAARVIDGMH